MGINKSFGSGISYYKTYLQKSPRRSVTNGILLLVRLFSLFRHGHGPSVRETSSFKILVCAGILCFDFKRSSGLCGIYPGEQSCCRHVVLNCRTSTFFAGKVS